MWIFLQSELKIVSDFGNAEIRLLGFKPASIIGLENFVRPCAFIYPDETTYKGNFFAFSSVCLFLCRKC